VVHRLDRGTSGCLILALRKSSEEALLQAFDQGLVEKSYLAVVQGAPPDEGRFDTAYGQDPRDRRRYTTRIETPRRARLSWVKISQREHDAVLRVALDTGRTHQIRVQFSEAGFPVLGDDTYGRAGGRLMLHAERIAFPLVGHRIECEAPRPEGFS
jgi:23S rRNA pseudouridine1911/1915/1917 synthase